VRACRPAAGLRDREQRAGAGSVENGSRSFGKWDKPEQLFVEDPKTLRVRGGKGRMHASIGQHVSASSPVAFGMTRYLPVS
jgi:hypothetical protein